VPAEVHNLATLKNLGKARRLLQSLVPRAQSFSFYDAHRQCAWSSDGAEDYEIDAFVDALPEPAFTDGDDNPGFIRRTLKSGRTLLVMPLTQDGERQQGLLVVGFSRNAGKSSWFNPGMLQGILAPALEVIGETLTLQRDVDLRQQQRDALERELALVYEIDEQLHGKTRSNAGLAKLVGQSGRYLNVCYSVLLIPSKRIRISATHSSWKTVNRKVLDRYLVEQILPQIDGQHVPIVFEMSAEDETDGIPTPGYQALVCPIMDQSGNTHGVLAQLGRVNKQPFAGNHRRFMSNIRRKVEYVIEQSFDAMTGLMNRAGFEAQLYESWADLDESGDQHQLIYIDLDNLQLVNDTFGRAAGDAVVMRFARLLETDLPKSAVVSRLTGDDFCILLTRADEDAALRHARDLRKRCETLRYLEGDKSLQVTISVGIASFGNGQGEDSRGLTAARMACESAKDHGRDRIEVYNLDNQSLIRRHDDMQLVSEIQQALDSDGFDLLAQPISSLRADDTRPRFEILLRMRDSEGQNVPSAAFFSAAERYQIMPQIDRWVVSNTIARLSRYRDSIALQGALFSINLSGQSLSDDDLLEFVEDELASGAVPDEAIGFEVTESAAVSNLAKAQNFINALHERGCRISLDDFGAGLSSFAYLKNFRVDTLKIDGSFVRDITDNRISESMVAAITQVAKVMHLDTVAEYVECGATRKLVAELGVDFAQGHEIGKPRPLLEVLEELDGGVELSTG
jgi:diguanylate cyclase (GGDEF)-like protein